jgi:tRNA (uracil-5-)-methyltransferase TRM9
MVSVPRSPFFAPRRRRVAGYGAIRARATGKYLGANPRCFFVGSDMSAGLAHIAQRKGPGRVGFEISLCDNLQLPYRAAAFDAVISIAVLHHLSTPGRRLAALRELFRVLRPGGRMLVYVWSLEEGGQKKGASIVKPGVADALVPWTLTERFAPRADAPTSPAAPADAHSSPPAAIPAVSRYYHMFCEGELEALCGRLDGAVVEDRGMDNQVCSARAAVPPLTIACTRAELVCVCAKSVNFARHLRMGVRPLSKRERCVFDNHV